MTSPVVLLMEQMIMESVREFSLEVRSSVPRSRKLVQVSGREVLMLRSLTCTRSSSARASTSVSESPSHSDRVL